MTKKAHFLIDDVIWVLRDFAKTDELPKYIDLVFNEMKI